MFKAVEGGGDLSDNKSRYRNRYAGLIALNEGKAVDQVYGEDSDRLLNKLGKGRDAGLFSAQVIADNAAVHGCKRKCVGEQNEKLRTPFVL